MLTGRMEKYKMDNNEWNGWDQEMKLLAGFRVQGALAKIFAADEKVQKYAGYQKDCLERLEREIMTMGAAKTFMEYDEYSLLLSERTEVLAYWQGLMDGILSVYLLEEGSACQKEYRPYVRKLIEYFKENID